MPKAVHEKLKRQARKKGLKGERARRFIHGTLNKIEKKKKRRRSSRADALERS